MNLRFPGQYFDAESGFYYNVYRTYDPATGRYLSADPLGQLAGVNLFAYVHSDPMNGIDPLGLMKCSDVLPPSSACCTTEIIQSNWVNGPIRTRTENDVYESIRIPMPYMFRNEREYLGDILITVWVSETWTEQYIYFHLRWKNTCKPEGKCPPPPKTGYGDCEEDGTGQWKLIDHDINIDWRIREFDDAPLNGPGPPGPFGDNDSDNDDKGKRSPRRR